MSQGPLRVTVPNMSRPGLRQPGTVAAATRNGVEQPRAGGARSRARLGVVRHRPHGSNAAALIEDQA